MSWWPSIRLRPNKHFLAGGISIWGAHCVRCEHCNLQQKRRIVSRYESIHASVPDLLLVAGTSAMFPYIVEPVLSAQRSGRLSVEINPEETEASALFDFRLRGSADLYLPLIERALAAR